MSTPSVIPHNRMLKDASWLFDSQQQAIDNAIEAAYERRTLIEDAVSFDDVIEEVADFNPARAQVFMEALRSGDHYTVWLLCDQARERIVERALKGA